jgi:hypothetical protein
MSYASPAKVIWVPWRPWRDWPTGFYEDQPLMAA